MAQYKLKIDGRRFRDTHGREVTLRGINLSGDSKLPAKPPQYSHVDDGFFDSDTVSFIGRPFPLDEAHIHFSRLKSWGINTIRYVFTWEALEHSGPDKYDEEFIDFTIQVLRIAKSYGFYVFMDPHQDVWSRFTGGSGAPLWTLYACGFDPRKFAVTQAALVHNTWPKSEEYPKMIWTTNYARLAAQTMFTLFFGGKDFAPKAIIDGVNIQDYLQNHFINACKHLYKRIVEAGDLHYDTVLGFESVNEPNMGHLGSHDITAPAEGHMLKKGTTPTVWQTILSGSGRAVEVETYSFGMFGPYKTGTELVDPKGQSCWIDNAVYDEKYGFKRDAGWKLGECLWAQHGIWNPEDDSLLRRDYFAKHPTTGEKTNEEFFVNNWFMQFYRSFKSALRGVNPDVILLCEPTPFARPPLIKNTADDDPNMVYAAHFYDGITLVTKRWNTVWNVDVLGVLRGKYLSPALAVRFGETAIRNCIKGQLQTMVQEGIDNMGEHPSLFTEIGIPYDMDGHSAYKDGNYNSQSAAMDANHFGVEGSGAQGHMLWAYVATNNHENGDNWNGEDLSLFSVDDKPLPLARPEPICNDDSPYAQGSGFRDSASEASKTQSSLAIDDMSMKKTEDEIIRGYRAAEAYIRPTPIYTAGDLVSSGFDLRECTFHLSLTARKSTDQDHPTEIFLPIYHFPREKTNIEVTGGKWTITTEIVVEEPVQILKWWHAGGDQKISIKGHKRKRGAVVEQEEFDESYLEQYKRMICTMM